MLHVKPVPPTPSVSRSRAHFSSRAKAAGLAVHVSTVAAQLGNTITGWLLSELTAKSAQSNLHPSRTYTLKKPNGDILASSNGPQVVFYTPRESGPASPGQLAIPLGGKPEIRDEDVKSDETHNHGGTITTVDMPRPPPPARTSPPAMHVPSFQRKSPPTKFTECLPIAPKQLLPPLESVPMKSTSQRKPTPIHIVKPPTPDEEVEHLPTLPLPFSDLSYSSALDSTPYDFPAIPPAPLVPSSARFEHPSQRPRLQRTPSSSTISKDGFTFDFSPVVPEKDIHPHHRHPRSSRRPPRRGAAALECMQEMVLEYVEMRRDVVSKMTRSERFPVAGQLMNVTDCGSVYCIIGKINGE